MKNTACFVTQAVCVCWQPMQHPVPKQAEKLNQNTKQSSCLTEVLLPRAASSFLWPQQHFWQAALKKGWHIQVCEGTSGKLWKPRSGFISPRPLLTWDAACKTQWWCTQHWLVCTALLQPQGLYTHLNTSNHCRLQLLVQSGLHLPKVFYGLCFNIYKLPRHTRCFPTPPYNSFHRKILYECSQLHTVKCRKTIN